MTDPAISAVQPLGIFPKLPFITAKALGDSTPEEPDAMIPGVAVKGAITDLSAKVKAGKTTIVLHMVKAALDGSKFLNRQAVKGPVLYLTEEREATFRAALERAELLDHEDLHILHRYKVLDLEWAQVARLATQMAEDIGCHLVIVDTLSRWAKIEGDDEQSSGHAAAAVAPLEEMASHGIAVIQARHDGKGEAKEDPSDAGRGSSAFAGSADIIINLSRPKQNGHANRRMIRAISRFGDLPEELLIDLEDDGYVEVAELEGETVRKLILGLLTKATEMPEKTIVTFTSASRSTVRDSLDHLMATMEISREKKGRAWVYSLSTF